MQTRIVYDRELQNLVSTEGGATSRLCRSALTATRFAKCANFEHSGYSPRNIPNAQLTTVRMSRTSSSFHVISRWARFVRRLRGMHCSRNCAIVPVSVSDSMSTDAMRSCTLGSVSKRKMPVN
eukprot:74802-Rhodomonas_salina.2